ncbi:hypothetical protein [Streptomyces sp. NPDC059928]|uniref:hypothetical protein n=1 Tax=unclassified Streptomyces TaxID=2593676 RepID=UPI00365104DE
MGHRAHSFLACPMVPDGLHEDLTDRMSAPPSIAVPAQPARAAWRITDRLLPRYAAATAQARAGATRTALVTPPPLPLMTASPPPHAGRTRR